MYFSVIAIEIKTVQLPARWAKRTLCYFRDSAMTSSEEHSIPGPEWGSKHLDPQFKSTKDHRPPTVATGIAFYNQP